MIYEIREDSPWIVHVDGASYEDDSGVVFRVTFRGRAARALAAEYAAFKYLQAAGGLPAVDAALHTATAPKPPESAPEGS